MAQNIASGICSKRMHAAKGLRGAMQHAFPTMQQGTTLLIDHVLGFKACASAGHYVGVHCVLIKEQ